MPDKWDDVAAKFLDDWFNSRPEGHGDAALAAALRQAVAEAWKEAAKEARSHVAGVSMGDFTDGHDAARHQIARALEDKSRPYRSHPMTTPDTAPTPERVEELLKLSEAATPGDWRMREDDEFDPGIACCVYTPANDIASGIEPDDAAHMVGFCPATAASLCRSWLAMRGEVERGRAEEMDELEWAELTSTQGAVETLLTALGWKGGGLGSAAIEIVAQRDSLAAQNATLSARLEAATGLLKESRQFIVDFVNKVPVGFALDPTAMLAQIDAALAAPAPTEPMK